MKTRSSEDPIPQEEATEHMDETASSRDTASTKEASSKEASGKEASGKEASGKETSSKETSGKETSGKEASGKEASGKEASSKETSSSSHHTKKSKKHKHKKHKKKREGSLSHDLSSQAKSEFISSDKPQFKLKIKFDGETFTSKSVARSSVTDVEPFNDDLNDELEEEEEEEEEEVVEEEVWQESEETVPPKSEEKAPPPPSTEEDIVTGVEEEEEEAWLQALEAGELDEYGEIKKEKDVTALTARQRAIRQMKGDEDQPLWELPSGQKSPDLTEEGIQKKAVRAQRRRDQAQKKDLENKKQTIERLLKKQEVKSKLLRNRAKWKLSGVPRMQYVNSMRGITLSLPAGMDYSLQYQPPRLPPLQKLCGVAGCENPKKYSCSKTGIPLCSLRCYKQNLLSSSSGALVGSVT